MNLLKPVLLAFAAFVATQAQAVPVAPYTFTFTTFTAGTTTAPTFTDISKSSVQTTSLAYSYLQPLGTSGSYLVVSSKGGLPGAARIDTNDVTSYSFIWGSPDTFNDIAIFGNGGLPTVYTGTDLAAQFGLKGNGDNAETGLFTITANGNNVIDHLVLASAGVAFEIAAPVPEPETYALMLGGLGALAFMSRRKRA